MNEYLTLCVVESISNWLDVGDKSAVSRQDVLSHKALPGHLQPQIQWISGHWQVKNSLSKQLKKHNTKRYPDIFNHTVQDVIRKCIVTQYKTLYEHTIHKYNTLYVHLQAHSIRWYPNIIIKPVSDDIQPLQAHNTRSFPNFNMVLSDCRFIDMCHSKGIVF